MNGTETIETKPEGERGKLTTDEATRKGIRCPSNAFIETVSEKDLTDPEDQAVS